MKNFVFLISVVSLFSCSKSDEMSPAGSDLNVFFEFSVFNSQDNDLLDPTTPHHYKEEGIKLFYEVDGEIIEVYDPNMGAPRNFYIYKLETEYRIVVYLNYTETSEKPITYIQWNDTDTDTIEATFKRNRYYIGVSQVWLNELEIWDSTIVDNQYFKLIK